MKNFGLILTVSILILIILFAGLLQLGRFTLHNTEIPLQDQLISDESPQRFLAFFAHPDDEIAMGGTLLGLREAGHSIVLVYATKGEAGPTGGLVSQEELGEARAKEMQRAAEILGAEELLMYDFPDSGLKDIPFQEVKDLAKKLIDQYQPDYLLSYDAEVGLYGHPDHVVVSKALMEVFLENKGNADFTPKQLFQLTLSPKQVSIALRISPGFQKNYPTEGKALPMPDIAVKTSQHFPTLSKMMEAHATQAEVFKDLLPYHDRLPQWLYSRIFDREYFHIVE